MVEFVINFKDDIHFFIAVKVVIYRIFFAYVADSANYKFLAFSFYCSAKVVACQRLRRLLKLDIGEWLVTARSFLEWRGIVF